MSYKSEMHLIRDAIRPEKIYPFAYLAKRDRREKQWSVSRQSLMRGRQRYEDGDTDGLRTVPGYPTMVRGEDLLRFLDRQMTQKTQPQNHNERKRDGNDNSSTVNQSGRRVGTGVPGGHLSRHTGVAPD